MFQLLSGDNEKFGGDTLLSGQEDLKNIRRMTDGWTDCSLSVFNRHRGEAGENYPDHDEMLKMNEVYNIKLFTTNKANQIKVRDKLLQMLPVKSKSEIRCYK